MVNSNGINGHSILLDFKKELFRLTTETMNDLSRKVEGLLAQTNSNTGKGVFDDNVQNNTIVSDCGKKKKVLTEKEFIRQNSLLSDLFQFSHIESLLNAVLAIAIVWISTTLATDALNHRSFRVLYPTFHWLGECFHNYHEALVYWLAMLFCSMALYSLCYLWCISRPNGSRGTFDLAFYTAYSGFILTFFWVPCNFLFSNSSLGSACATAIGVEQLRLIMKMHSFFREVTKKIHKVEAFIAKKSDSDEHVNINVSASFPSFSKYLYFLFAPTLVFREKYPENEFVDWHFVWSNFCQFFGCVMFIYYVFRRYLRPEYLRFSDEGMTLEHAIRGLFRCTVPGFITLMAAFFGFLHSWLNAWAEMLKFGDRMFYKNWWNAQSFAEWFRTWNCVVHDWLYAYIFKEAIEVFKVNKYTAVFLVFAISAFFHEYIVAVSLNFVYPVLLIHFGILGLVFFFVTGKGRVGNVFIWASLIIGMGSMLNLYSSEIAARKHCPQTLDYLTDAIVPRSWTCTSWITNSNAMEQQ